MALIRVPGFGGIYVVDTGSGNIQRVGREGGLRNPVNNQLNGAAHLSEVGAELSQSAINAINSYNGPPMSHGGGGGGGGGGGSISFEMTPQEQQLLELQIKAIEDANKVQQDILAREGARRKAYNRFLSGERFTPTNMEEEQGLLAARAGRISGIEQDRLEKALEGKLPVSPSTERGIREGQAVVEERLRRNLGTDYASSSPGIEQLTKTAESAEILKDIDRKGYIERGIQPSITAAQFSQDAVGQYLPGEIPGLSSTLSGMRSNRQMAQQYDLGLRNVGLGEQQLGLGYAELAGQNQRFAQAQASDYINSRRSTGTPGGWGGGFGSLVGGLLGGAASMYFNQGSKGSGGGGSSAWDLYG